MIRRYSWAALALAAVACGDSGDSSGGGGSGSKDASTGGTGDAGTTIVVTPEKSTDTGKACSDVSECGGTAGQTQCLTTQMGQIGGGSITFPDGYCTASCTQDSECNPSGGSAAACPAGGLVNAAQSQGGAAGIGALLGGFATQLSVCLVKCDASTPCRDGYQCATVSDFIVSAAPMLENFKTFFGALGLSPATVCVPTPENISAGDGGLPTAADAGTDAAVPFDAGSDAGSTTDAGTDAGSDAGDAG
jgi:hypothetical protein